MVKQSCRNTGLRAFLSCKTKWLGLWGVERSRLLHGGGEKSGFTTGDQEGEELTLSKLANRLGSLGAWLGEEGAKGSGTESLAGREENSPEPCALNRPRLWNDSDDSDRWMLDRLPLRTQTHKQTTQHSDTDDRVDIKENHLRFILVKHTEQEPAHLGVEVEVWLVFRFWAVMREVHLTECPP